MSDVYGTGWASKNAVGYAPDNAYIENIINNDILPSAEHFICHKASQDLSGGELAILDKCDDCGLCNIRCPYSNIDYTTFFLRNWRMLFLMI